MPKVQAYNLEPSFEHKVLHLLVSNPKFYGSVGYLLDPDAMGSALATLLVKATKQIFKDLGHGPSDESIVLQRVRRMVGDGQVTQDQLDDVIDFFIELPLRMPPVTEVMNELSPILKRRMEAEVVRAAMDGYAKGDFETAKRIMHAADRVGRVDTSHGLRLGKEAFGEIDRLRNIDRLSTGIDELDAGLDGGLPRGCLGVYVGGPGAGKSMMLAHIASRAVMDGYFVAVATLELNRAAWMARVMANITNTPVNVILREDASAVAAKIEALFPVLGTLLVMDFPAEITTIPDITSWAKDVGEAEGVLPHLICVDYPDKCRSHNQNDRDPYTGQKTVYETLRLFCHENGIWGWGASQPVRRAGKDKERKISIDDLADSQHKARIADLLLSGNPTKDGDQIDYNCPKFRYGKSNWSVGPLPHDWACGRMVMLPD